MQVQLPTLAPYETTRFESLEAEARYACILLHESPYYYYHYCYYS